MSKLVETLNSFVIGDIVYIIGKYAFEEYAPLMLVTAQISHIDDSGFFIAYGINGCEGTYRFTNKRYDKWVFTDKNKAIEVFNRCKKELGEI